MPYEVHRYLLPKLLLARGKVPHPSTVGTGRMRKPEEAALRRYISAIRKILKRR
jgi:hypothetical protein